MTRNREVFCAVPEEGLAKESVIFVVACAMPVSAPRKRCTTESRGNWGRTSCPASDPEPSTTTKPTWMSGVVDKELQKARGSQSHCNTDNILMTISRILRHMLADRTNQSVAVRRRRADKQDNNDHDKTGKVAVSCAAAVSQEEQKQSDTTVNALVSTTTTAADSPPSGNLASKKIEVVDLTTPPSSSHSARASNSCTRSNSSISGSETKIPPLLPRQRFSISRRDSPQDQPDIKSARSSNNVQAYLDESLVCQDCQASHAFYIMYKVSNPCKSANSGYLCSQCWNEHDEDGTEPEDGPVELSCLLDKSPINVSTAPILNKETVLLGPSPATASSTLSSKHTSPSYLSGSLLECNLQACVDLLHAVENERQLVNIALSKERQADLLQAMQREVPMTPPQQFAGNKKRRKNPKDNFQFRQEYQQQWLQDRQELIQEDLKEHQRLWLDHWDRLEDTITVLHEAIEHYHHHQEHEQQTTKDSELDETVQGDLLLAYYQWRSRFAWNDDRETPPRWKARADQQLDERDQREATGYQMGRGQHANPKSKDAETVDDLWASREEQIYCSHRIGQLRGHGWSARLPTLQVLQFPTDQEDLEQVMTKSTIRQWCSEEQDQRKQQEEQATDTSVSFLKWVPREDPPQRDKIIQQSPPKRTSTRKRCAASIASSTPANRPQLLIAPKGTEHLFQAERSFQDHVVSPVKKRKPRRCQRCIRFEGTSPTQCRGAMGYYGQKGCEYFLANGSPKRHK